MTKTEPLKLQAPTPEQLRTEVRATRCRLEDALGCSPEADDNDLIWKLRCELNRIKRLRKEADDREAQCSQ